MIPGASDFSLGRNGSIVCHSERMRGTPLYVENQLIPLLFEQIHFFDGSYRITPNY